MSGKHTIFVSGDDGRLYRITHNDLRGHEVSEEDPDYSELRAGFDSGLTHGVAEAGKERPPEEPPLCHKAESPGESVHFLNLATSADPDKD